jgi:hypothetical protein
MCVLKKIHKKTKTHGFSTPFPAASRISQQTTGRRCTGRCGRRRQQGAERRRPGRRAGRRQGGGEAVQLGARGRARGRQKEVDLIDRLNFVLDISVTPTDRPTECSDW